MPKKKKNNQISSFYKYTKKKCKYENNSLSNVQWYDSVKFNLVLVFFLNKITLLIISFLFLFNQV